MEFFTHTEIENTKLSPWYFAVHWSSMLLQQKIADMEAAGGDPVYDIHQLENLQELEMFLKMSWDQWLDNLQARQTALEAK
jgi:hypothetical protein